MASDYSTPAFVLGLIGGILVLLIGGILGIFAAMAASTMAMVGAVGWAALVWISLTVGLVSGVIMIVGSVMIKKPEKRVTGSVLLLIFSIISIFTVSGGLFIGALLGIIGGALGLASKPETTTVVTTGA